MLKSILPANNKSYSTVKANYIILFFVAGIFLFAWYLNTSAKNTRDIFLTKQISIQKIYNAAHNEMQHLTEIRNFLGPGVVIHDITLDNIYKNLVVYDGLQIVSLSSINGKSAVSGAVTAVTSRHNDKMVFYPLYILSIRDFLKKTIGKHEVALIRIKPIMFVISGATNHDH